MTGPEIEQLRKGDEVKLYMGDYPGVVISGPVSEDPNGCCLHVGPYFLIQNGGSCVPPDWRVEVTKRAPRPVYRNHTREEAVEGDIVRDAITASRVTYTYSGNRWWLITNGSFAVAVDVPKMGLILLVDGDTGLPPEKTMLPERLADPPKLSGMAQDPNRPGYGPPSRYQGS